MRTVLAILVAAVSGFALTERGVAAPPEDIAAQCRASFPQVSLQVRCTYLEYAAAQRVAGAAAGVAGDLFNRCLVVSQSWTAMESCLAQVASVPGSAANPPVTTGAPGAPGNAGAVQPPSGTPGTPAETSSPTPDAADAASPRTTPPGAAGPVSAVTEPDRPTRVISEADAERQLRAVLERVGYPGARCTKKQYGPGWASVCE